MIQRDNHIGLTFDTAFAFSVGDVVKHKASAGTKLLVLNKALIQVGEVIEPNYLLRQITADGQVHGVFYAELELERA